MIYVIAHDGGYEGYSGPIQAFRSEKEARSAAALGESLRVFLVPEWPESADPWFLIEPLPERPTQAES